MGVVGEILGTPLGYLMKLCYDLIKDYGFAIILFTLLTKVVLLPLSLWVQKNSIRMIKIKPKLDSLKFQYVDDKDGLLDAQSDLYKAEKYNPFAGTIPLLIQLPIIFGLIDVVYRPLKHLLHFPKEVIGAFIQKTSQLTGIADLGSSPELMVMKSLGENKEAFLALGSDTLKNYNVPELVDKALSINMNFFGFDLAAIPQITVFNLMFLIPVLAGLSALLMCVIQNKINVLQMEQNAASKWGMTIFMIAFSAYFAFLVPGGVGIYWVFGNLFSIPVMYLVNHIYSPKKYIDYDTLNKLKERAALEASVKKENTALSKKYYKELCANGGLQKMKLMIYSEGSGYYKYFQNIVEALLAKSEEIIYYITSDPKDKIFEMNNPRIKPYYIGDNHLIALMMKLECQMVVMTTPDLEKYHIKRSRVRKNIEYVYVDHACSSLSLTYRPGAMDHFDTVMAVSRDQGIEIREMERLRSSKRKRIVKSGYGLIDNMIEAYEKMEKVKNEKPTILVAPSWQHDNLLDSCIDDILTSLITPEFKVIVRPHPQYIKRFPVEMEKLIERYKNKFSEDFSIETDFSSNVTVYTADLLVTDWSAIAFEFSFTTDKPSLFVNTEMKVLNKDYDKLNIEPFDIRARNLVGKSIEKSDCINIGAVATEFISQQDKWKEQISTLKKEYFYNLGSSGAVTADYIIEKLSKDKG